MKRSTSLTALATALCVTASLLSACHKDDYGKMSEVAVNVNDFNIVNDEIGGGNAAKSTSVENASEVKSITLAFYDAAGTEKYQCTHTRSDSSTFRGTAFGKFHCTLPSGNYTMVAIGYGSNYAITLSSKTSAEFSNDRVRDCFVSTRDLSISSSGVNNITATLNRIASQFWIKSTDNQPAGVDSIRFSVNKGGKIFNPQTGLSTTDNGHGFTVTDASGITGYKLNAPVYLLLHSNEEVLDFTFTVYKDGNILTTKTIPNVTMKRNRRTLATGGVYTNTGSNFLIASDWISTDTVYF